MLEIHKVYGYVWYAAAKQKKHVFTNAKTRKNIWFVSASAFLTQKSHIII